MKTYKNVTLINYEGEAVEMSMCLGAREIMFFEKTYRELSGNKKATLFNSLELLNEGDMGVIISLISSTLHKQNKAGVATKQPLGIDEFDENFDIFKNIEVLMAALEVVMKDIQADGQKSGK